MCRVLLLFACCCRTEEPQSTLPRIEIVVDNGIPWIPEIEVVNENGEILGSSSQADAAKQKVDIMIHRLGTAPANVTNVLATESMQQCGSESTAGDASMHIPVSQQPVESLVT